MKRNRVVSLALVGLFAWTAACTTYKQIQPTEVGGQDHVVVKTSDGERRSLYDPEIAADSIKGKIERGSQVSQAYPLDQVAEVKSVGTHDIGSATVFILAGIAVVAVIIAAVPLEFGG